MQVLRQQVNYRVVLARPSVAEDTEWCQKFYRLRDAVFAVKYHWEEPRGEERDSYDDAAEFFLVLKGEEVIAGCRAIYRERLACCKALSATLPIEEFLTHPLSDRAIELSRMINVGSRSLGLILYEAMYEYLILAKQRHELHAVIRKPFLALLARKLGHLGLAFVEISTQSKYRGEETFLPVRIELAACAVAA